MNNHNIAKLALKKFKQLRIATAEFSLSQSSGFTVDARLGEVETLEHHLNKNFSVTVYHDQRTGHASSSDFSVEAIQKTIEKAVSIASFSSQDIFAGLADVSRLAMHYPDCDLYHPWNITPPDAIQLAIACEKKALSFDKRIVNSDGASICSNHAEILYANTLGFLGEFKSSKQVISCSVVASENNKMQRDSDYTIARHAKDLWSADQVAISAAEKTVRRLNPMRVKTQTCPVIFEASIAKSLLGHFVTAISGGNLYRQSSFLLNALGKPIFPVHINIFKQPHLLSEMGSRPFDHDGVATIDQHYIRDGQLENYVLGTYSARKLGMQTTGNAGGVFNLGVNGSGSVSDLIRKMDRGLFITELMGQGVNITTGDYSRGASGFWVEKGEIQFPVEEITIAGNLKNMFAGIIAIADDVDVRGTIRAGSILIDQMTVAGE